MNVAGVDLPDYFCGRVSQHAFRAHIEEPDDAVRVGRDHRKVGAVENGRLQSAVFQQQFTTIAIAAHLCLSGGFRCIADWFVRRHGEFR